ncbi:MFS transporter [Nonomuraea sp. 3-1Str]|uniref:MFS transporter n=1 Tax=Nonomuraea sp. 3-1Str TaxID=2929801 RepID=UPI00286005A4|nr:MFS transporter [Nonomuraea sp. 3-1Str]MDR8410640.1 MFS transporter [Nonomuraea sp. 3-1Str]
MTTGVLRSPDFIRFLSSHVADELGVNISRVALPLVAVLVLNAGALEVGLLSALQTAAFLAIGLPAGVWVDRMSKRRVMITADLVRCALLASIPLAYMLGLLSMGMMLAVALLAGMAQVFDDVADQTYLPELVSKQSLSSGNSKLEFVRSGGALAGPSLGGLLVQALGAPLTVFATALASLGSAILLTSIRTPDRRAPAGGRRTGMLRDIREGLVFVWRDRLLRAIVTTTAGTNLCVSAVLGLSVLFLADEVRLAPGVIGVLLMSGAVGGLLGGLTGTWLFTRYGTARVTWLAIAVTSPFGLLLPMTQADWRVAFFSVTSIALSWGAILYNVGQITYRQMVAPERMLGRINATVRFLVWGTMPLGALLGGLVAQQIGVREALWLFMAGRLVSFLPLLFSPLPRMRDFTQVRTDP